MGRASRKRRPVRTVGRSGEGGSSDRVPHVGPYGTSNHAERGSCACDRCGRPPMEARSALSPSTHPLDAWRGSGTFNPPRVFCVSTSQGSKNTYCDSQNPDFPVSLPESTQRNTHVSTQHARASGQLSAQDTGRTSTHASRPVVQLLVRCAPGRHASKRRSLCLLSRRARGSAPSAAQLRRTPAETIRP